MDRFEALRTFIAVVDHAGFAAAARALDLAPAAVTRRVAELESHLGVKLLTRTTRSLALTIVGAAYLERVRPLLAALEEADKAAASSAHEVAGRVRVSTPADFLREVLVHEIAALRTDYPKLEVELVVEDLRMQPAESCDLTVLLDHGMALDGDFVARPIAQTTAMVCAAPSYLAAHPPITHPRDLDLHPMLLPSLAMMRRDFHLSATRQAEPADTWTFRPSRTPMESSSSDALLAAALAGHGLVGTLSFVAHSAIASGRLVRVLPDWRIETWRLYVVYQRQSSLTAAARTLVEHLQQRLGHGRTDPWLAR